MCDSLNLTKRIIVFLSPFIWFHSFPQPLLLIPVGGCSHCKHIINFFQIWNWVEICPFPTEFFWSVTLSIISSNHVKNNISSRIWKCFCMYDYRYLHECCCQIVKASSHFRSATVLLISSRSDPANLMDAKFPKTWINQFIQKFHGSYHGRLLEIHIIL